MKRFSLKTRLILWLMPALTLVLAAAAIGLYLLQRELLHRDFDRQLARNTFSSMRLLMRRGPRGAGDEDPLDQLAPLVYVATYAGEDHELLRVLPVGSVDGPWTGPIPDQGQPIYRTLRQGGRTLRQQIVRFPSRRSQRRPDRTRQRSSGQPTDEPDRATPSLGTGQSREAADADKPERPHRPPRRRPLVIVSAADLAPVHASLRNWATGLLAVCAGGEILLLIVVVLAIRGGLKPLRILARDIAAIDDRSLSHRMDAREVPTELATVVRQLNALLARLDNAFIRERAFLAGAAHELRTPLAGLRSQLEVCLRRRRDNEEYNRVLARCLESAVAMQSMVTSLLDLARLETSNYQPRIEHVDLAEMLRKLWAEIAGQAHKRHLVFRDELPETLEVSSDPFLLQRILSNLLSNAVAYADEGTTVVAATERRDSMVRIRVTNVCSELSPAEVEEIFNPFWRRDHARTQPGRHAGLGLSVVSQCVSRLGGKIRAQLNGASTIALVLDLPVDPPA
jgi:two-component system heavy metal sensor histidine kinase CusS